MDSGRWELVEQVLLRRAGFPFALLDAAACPGAAAAAARAAACNRAADAHRSALLTTHFPAAVTRAAGDAGALRALSRWRRKVGTRRAVDVPAGAWPPELVAEFDAFRRATEQAVGARRAVAEALADEAPRAADALRARAADTRVREAVFLLSPDAHATVEHLAPLPSGARRGAKDRSRDRLLYRYLQRLGAKNETTSFFGPLTYATVEPSATDVRTGPEGPGGVVHRGVFASFWAAATIAHLAARDPAIRPHLPVRRMPLAPAAEDPLLALVDGWRTTVEVAAAAGVTLREADGRLADLERRRVVRRDLEPLSTTPRPLDDLAARLPDVDGAGRWHAVVERFRDHLAAFAAAPYAERTVLLGEIERWFTDVTRRPARRKGGEMYADRGILYEECLGDGHPFVLPGREADRVTSRLAPILDLCATYGRLRHEGLRALGAEVLAERGEPLGFPAFADALAEAAEPARLDRHLAAADAWLAALARRVAAASDGHVARLSSGDLVDLADPGGAPRFVSPDVLLERGAPGEPPRPVLGELHPYVSAWGSQGLFAPDPQALQSAYRRDLRAWGGAERLCTVLRRRRHKGLVTEAFPGRFVEVSGRASHDQRRCVPIDALRVTSGPDGPRLCAPDGDITLYCGEDDHPHLQVFGPPQVLVPPVRLGARTPRVEIDGVPVRRERWELPEALRADLAAADPADLLVAVARARLDDGWPRHCFAHGAGEPKPLYLDLDSALALDVLRSLAAAGDVTLVEMVPTPERLWLRRSDGPCTSELRVALVRS